MEMDGHRICALSLRLAHFGHQCPLIFSNLNSGRPDDWHDTIRATLARYRPTEHRSARDLFDWIVRECLVNRPAQGRIRSGSGEPQWVDEAIRPAPANPINQVVTSRTGEADCRRVFANIIGLPALDRAAFWAKVTTAAEFGTNIVQQIQGLRPIWLHGQILALVLPYGLDTSPNGEADWFFSFASRAFGRPSGHGTPRIEFHVSFDGNGADMMAQGENHQAVQNLTRQAQRQIGLRGHEFLLYVRAKSYGTQRYIARRLFTGEERIENPSKPDIGIRWGISLEHVAHLNDSPNQTPPTFSLLPRQKADDQFRTECRESLGPRLAGPLTVRC